MSGRIIREKRTVEKMLLFYCRLNHNNESLCSDCRNLLDYSYGKLSACPFSDDKPACNDCKVHCYLPYERQKIKAVMQFSGPKMLFRHPYLAIMHLIDCRRKKSEKYYSITRKINLKLQKNPGV